MKKITIKPEHIVLLAETNWYWQDCEFGAPEVDPKRHYGNSTGTADVLRVLGWEQNPEYDDWSKTQYEQAWKLHKELLAVLKILSRFATTGIRPGETYRNRSDYSDDWEKVE